MKKVFEIKKVTKIVLDGKKVSHTAYDADGAMDCMDANFYATEEEAEKMYNELVAEQPSPMTKKEIFTAAWTISDKADDYFTGKPSDYFSEALKEVYTALAAGGAKAVEALVEEFVSGDAIITTRRTPSSVWHWSTDDLKKSLEEIGAHNKDQLWKAHNLKKTGQKFQKANFQRLFDFSYNKGEFAV